MKEMNKSMPEKRHPFGTTQNRKNFFSPFFIRPETAVCDLKFLHRTTFYSL